MNISSVVSKLEKKYPGKKIILDPQENPTEIICEIKPGFAIAIIDQSKLHYHKKATEIYEVLKGNLIIAIDGKEHHLKEQGKITIKPGEKHSVKGSGTWINCFSEPAWSQEDHILTK